MNKLPAFLLTDHILPHLSVTDILILSEMDKKTEKPSYFSGTNYHQLTYQTIGPQNFIQRHIDYQLNHAESLSQVFSNFCRQKICKIPRAKYFIVNKIVNQLFDYCDLVTEPTESVSFKNLSKIKKVVSKNLLSILSTEEYPPKNFAIAHIKNLDIIILDQKSQVSNQN